MEEQAKRDRLLASLRESLNSGDLEIVKRAADSLHKIGGDPVAALSSMTLNELSDCDQRTLALRALEHLDSGTAASVVQRLRGFLANADAKGSSAEELVARKTGPQSDPSNWWIFGPLIALAILWPAYSVYRFNHPKSPSAPSVSASDSEGATGSAPSDQSTMAVVQCQNYVKDRLRSPSTADFPWLDHAVVPRGNETYMVKSYVDAQNGFGATVRNDYICEIRYTGGEAADQGNWSLIDLSLSVR